MNKNVSNPKCFYCGSPNTSVVNKGFLNFMVECADCGSIGPTKLFPKAARKAYVPILNRHEMDDILSCPFCPERAVSRSRFYCDGELQHNVACMFCLSMTGICDSSEEAAALWIGGASDD